MAGINKVILVGNLGANPEVKYNQAGKAVANLSVATSESWTDKNTGQKNEKTEWHRVILFGKLAEISGQYLSKGSKVYVEGKLQTRKWQDQNGQDKYTTEVIVSGFSGTLQMLDKKDGNQPQQPAQQPQQQPAQGAPVQQQAPAQQQQDGNPFDDDIPF